MSLYSEKTVQALQQQLTSFRAEGGYVTFYQEQAYTPGTTRSSMPQVGCYLFQHGIHIQESIAEHPAIQPFNSDQDTLFAAAKVSSTLQINALYVQESSDLLWIAPGHPPLIAFVDYFVSVTNPRANDVQNSLATVAQTIVVRNLRCIGKTIESQDASSVNYSLSFTGGRVTRLASTTMDLP